MQMNMEDILRDKHKGPVGQYILLKNLKGVNR